MFTTSTIRAHDERGREHAVRIAQGYANTRYVVCDTCGERRSAYFAARHKAEDHLAETHRAVRHMRQELSPAPWIWGVVCFLALLVFMATML